MAAARHDSESPLARAVSRVGSQTATAKLLGVSQMAVSRWVRGVAQLPAEHVLAVEAATGVSKHDLRPDIYPPEPHAEPYSRRDEGAMEPAR